jgi:outer membrane protein with beta-barrel domain
MKNLVGLFILGLIFCMPAMAQDVPKYEIGGGAAYRSFDQFSGTRLNTFGWEAYGDYHIWRFINVAGEIAGTYNRFSSSGSVNKTNTSTDIYSFLVGPQLYPFGHHHKITPYAHVLFGGGDYRFHINQVGFTPFSTSYFGPVWMGGGGLDWKFKEHWSIRLIQADYEQTRFLVGAAAQTNYRASIGLVYRFREK